MKNRIKQIALLIFLVVGMLSFGIFQLHQPSDPTPPIQQEESSLQFRSEKHFEEHYEKHVLNQEEFGSITKEEYLELAQDFMNRTPPYVLLKNDGGNTLFYDPQTNSFGVLSRV